MSSADEGAMATSSSPPGDKPSTTNTTSGEEITLSIQEQRTSTSSSNPANNIEARQSSGTAPAGSCMGGGPEEEEDRGLIAPGALIIASPDVHDSELATLDLTYTRELGTRPYGNPDKEREWLEQAITLNRKELHHYWFESMAARAAKDQQCATTIKECPEFIAAWERCQILLEHQEMLRAELDRVQQRQHEAHEFEELFGPAGHGFAPLPEGHVTPKGGLFRRVYCRQYFKDGIMYREKGERKVAWTELFFDLAFAVIINRIGVTLEQDVNLRQILTLQIIFLCIYRQWTRAQIFINAYDNDDLLMKLYYLIQMTSLVGVGSFLTENDTQHLLPGMTASYMISLLGSFLVRVRAMAQDHTLRGQTALTGLQDLLFAVIMIPALFLQTMNPVYWWGAALVVDTLYNFWRSLTAHFAFNIEHMHERFGLFQVLVFAERLVALFIDGEQITAQAVAAAVCSIASTLAMQILYFDVIHGPGKLAKHALRRKSWRTIPWYLLHGFLANATVFSGPGILLLMESAVQKAHKSKASYYMLFCWAEASSLMALSLLQLVHKMKRRRDVNVSPRWRFGGRILVALIIALLPLAEDGLPGYMYVVISGLLVTLWTIFDLWGSLKTFVDKRQKTRVDSNPLIKTQ